MAKKQEAAASKTASVVMTSNLMPSDLFGGYMMCPGLRHMVREGQDIPGRGRVTTEEATVSVPEDYAAYLCGESGRGDAPKLRIPLARRAA